MVYPLFSFPSRIAPHLSDGRARNTKSLKRIRETQATHQVDLNPQTAREYFGLD